MSADCCENPVGLGEENPDLPDLSFQRGLKDGLPICLGYISVSFAFGMTVAQSGMPIWAALFISATNVTSAGQFAGFDLILHGAKYLEIAITTLVINLRYFLMSLSLVWHLSGRGGHGLFARGSSHRAGDYDLRHVYRHYYSAGAAVAPRGHGGGAFRRAELRVLLCAAVSRHFLRLGDDSVHADRLHVRGAALPGKLCGNGGDRMNTAYVVSCALLMAGVTYVIRMLPMAVFQRRLENRFVRSFLAYVPYAVLSAMTFPQILYSAGGTAASAAGLFLAMVLAFRGKGLLVVALGAATAALLTQQLLLAGVR